MCYRCVIVSTIALAHFNFARTKIRDDVQGSVVLPGWRGAKNCGDE